MLNALRDMGLEKVSDLLDDSFVGSMITQGAHVVGESALANGAIVSGMFWGGFTAFLIDGRIRPAIVVSVIAAVLTSSGVIHDSSLHWPGLDDSIAWSYPLLGAILYFASYFPLEREGDPGPQRLDAHGCETAARLLFHGQPADPRDRDVTGGQFVRQNAPWPGAFYGGEIFAGHVDRTLSGAKWCTAEIAELSGQESIIAGFLPPALVPLHAACPGICTAFKAAGGQRRRLSHHPALGRPRDARGDSGRHYGFTGRECPGSGEPGVGRQ